MLAWAFDAFLTPQRQEQVLVCDSFMYPQLTRGINRDELELTSPVLIQNFERVKKYQRQGKIGERQFTLLPVCEDQHWFLFFIIVEPSGDKYEAQAILMDSYPSASRNHVAKTIWLFLEFFLPGHVHTLAATLPVTRQTNGYDCGLHVITNVIRLLKLIGQGNIDADDVTTALNVEPCPITRENVRHVIMQLAEGTVPNNDDLFGSSTITNTTTKQETADTTTPTTADTIETLNVCPGQVIALDAKTFLENGTKDVWCLSSDKILEIFSVIERSRENIQSKCPPRRKFLKMMAGNKLSFHLGMKSGYTRVILLD